MFITLIALNLLVLIAGISIGPSKIGMEEIYSAFSGKEPENLKVKTIKDIVLKIRLPRTILAMLVGSALAVAGCSMQALFRNPLADPYIIGVSSGASVGAAMVFLLGIATSVNIMAGAFITALITVFVVYRIGVVEGRVPVYTLLLAGVAMASFLSGMTSLLIYIAGEDMSKVIFWIMGGFWTASWEKVRIATIPIILSAGFTLVNAWNLNAILLGEEHAISVGIDVEKLKRRIIVSSALLTATAVSVSGVIGFVGLIIPHMMRLIVGADHRILLPASLIFGSAFMPAVDIIARTAIEGELPVGIITAMLGAPFFLYLLRRGKM